MMRLLRFVVLLVLHVQLSESGAARGCCHPDRLMGQAYIIEEQKVFFIAIDFTRGLFYRTTDETKKWFNIVDFVGNRTYITHNGNCRVEEDPTVPVPTQCMTVDQNLGRYQLGRRSKGIAVDAFSYTTSHGANVWKTVTIEGNVCLPVTQHVSEGGINSTAIFYDLRPVVDFNNVQFSFDDCEEQIKQDDKPKGKAYASRVKRGASYFAML